jgi:hypothetical protein
MLRAELTRFRPLLQQTWSQIKEAGAWSFLPLLATVTLYALFEFCACHLELDQELWPVVATSIATGKTNASSSLSNAVARAQIVRSPADNSPAVPALHVHTSESKEPKQRAAQPTREFGVRLLWGMAGVLFSFLCLVVTVKSFRLMVEFTLQSRIWFFLLTLLAGLGFWCWKGLRADFDVPPTAGGIAGEELLRSIARNTDSIAPATLRTDRHWFGCLESARLDTNSLARLADTLWDAESRRLVAVKDVGGFTNTFSALSKVGLVAVALAACCILVHVRSQKKEALKKVDESIREYQRLGNVTDFLLQLAACAFVCGVMEIYLLYVMASYHVRAELQFEVQYFAQTFATAAGTIYSAFLLAIFLPLYAEQWPSSDESAPPRRRRRGRRRQPDRNPARSLKQMTTSVTCLS